MKLAPFAAVLLAGGRSLRMGRDKALLRLPDGRRLWERQRDVLQALEPAEWFISGAWREGFPAGLPWLADEIADRGPLAGIAAALEEIRSPRLLVLAVDLPAMSSDFLRGFAETRGERGIVPRQPDGFYEPLAAIYPKSAAPRAQERLQGDDLSLQAFVRDLVADQLVNALPVSAADAALFANWNHPHDVPA